MRYPSNAKAARHPGIRPGSRRSSAISLLLAFTLVSVTACTTGGPRAPVAGAPVTGALSPAPVTTATLPTLKPRITSSAASAPTTSSRLQPLVDSLTAALAGEGRVPPDVKLSQKAAAGEQVIVFWVVNTDPKDALAKQHVRSDAVKILTVIRASNVKYGSVLLAATGTILVSGKKKVTRVVRAKYTRPLVAATDWTRVRAEDIFTMCDDKPAIITPTFR